MNWIMVKWFGLCLETTDIWKIKWHGQSRLFAEMDKR